MYDDEDHRRYAESTRLEPIVEQHDDEMATSPTSSSSIDANFLEEERRSREDIKQFEELEKEFASNRHGVRVKFDDEPLSSVAQTTLIKTEPCFQVNSTEDQVTKHFYQNEYQLKDGTIPSKTPSEPDSLEEEYTVTFKQEKDLSYEPNENNKGIHHKVTDQVSSSSPGKSILKKPKKKEKVLTVNSDRSSMCHSPSPSSLKKKQTSVNHSDSNQVQHLAEATAKQAASQSSAPFRYSLFEPTINIFDSSNSNHRRPSRLQYYIKPYRGEAYIHPNTNKRQSRSLSEQRLAQKSESTVWYTVSNQYSRPLNKRQHISWSPVREYIHRGRDKIVKTPIKRKELFSSPISTRSSSNPCLQSTSSSMIPVSTRYRSSQIPHQHFPPSSVDSYETSSMINYSLTPNSQYEEKKEIVFTSPLPDIIHPQKKEHNETIQRYDRLLEKMRTTDEQLQILSRSWTNNKQQKTTVSTNHLFSQPKENNMKIHFKSRSNLSLNKTMNKKEFLSPMILQMCLMILVIINLLVVYFFNEINILWSQYVAHAMTAEQQDEETSNF